MKPYSDGTNEAQLYDKALKKTDIKNHTVAAHDGNLVGHIQIRKKVLILMKAQKIYGFIERYKFQTCKL